MKGGDGIRLSIEESSEGGGGSPVIRTSIATCENGKGEGRHTQD
jgi:hypothetical protein